MTIEIRMLGPPEIASINGPVALRPQSLHLLGLLVSANDWASGDALIDDLWPDDAPTSPKASLHVAIKRLRAACSDSDQQIVETNAFGYRLTPSASVDVWSWQTLVRAAHDATERDAKMREFDRAEALWRGPPYATVRNSLTLSREQERLTQHHDDIIVAHARMLTQNGQPGAALHKLDARPAERLTNEDAAIARLEAFHAANRADDGLRDAAEFRRHLRDHAGLSPSEAFDHAERLLLGTHAHVEHVRRDRPASFDELAWRPDLVESTHGRLNRMLTAERGAAIRVVAPPRFGMSRFVDELIGRTVREQPGIRVERIPPVGSLRTLRGAFAEVDVAPTTDQRSEHLEVLRRHLTRTDEPLDTPAAMRLVFVDDAQALDRWSRDLLDIASSIRLPAGYALIVATHDGDAVAMRSAISVHLGPLQHDEIAELTRAACPDLRAHAVERVNNRVMTWTSGEPLSVMASIDAVAKHGPDAELPVGVGTEDRAHERLDELGPDARQVITALAVVSFQIHTDAAATILALESSDIVEHLDSAALAGLVNQGSEGWTFASQPIQHILADGVEAPHRAWIHRRAARWFEDRNDLVSAAHHFDAALDLSDFVDADPVDRSELIDAAIASIDRASRSARDSRDFTEAARLAERLAEITADESLRRTARARQAHALDLAGRHRSANDLLNSLFDEAIGAGDLELVCELALAGGAGASRVGGLPDRRRRLRRARDRIDQSNVRHGVVVAEFALELVASQRPLDHEIRAELAAIASDVDGRSALLARRVVLADDERHSGGGLDDAIGLVADLGMGDSGDAFTESACLSVAIHVAMTAGALDRAESWIDDLGGVGERSGDARALWQSRAFRAAVFDARGHVKDADREIDAAREIALRLEMPDGVSSWLLHHLGRAFRSGSLATLGAGLEDAAERYRLPVWFALRALAQFDLGHEAAAAELLHLTIDSMNGSTDTFAAPAAAVATLVASRLDRPEMAIASANRLRQRRGRQLFLGYGGPYLGPVDWYLALGARAAGDDGMAAHLEHEALSGCNSIGARVWLTSGLRTAQ